MMRLLKKVIESDKWDLIAVGGITTAYSSIKKIVKLSKKFSQKFQSVLEEAY